MDVTKKIMESFRNMLPDDQVSQVEEAVNEFVENTKKQIQENYEKVLEESYKEWDEQLKTVKEEGENKLKEAEETAYQGYDEAKKIISEKEAEMASQKEEFDKFLLEQYNIAKEMIEEERSRNDQIEQELYESYNSQVEDIKDDLVNKLDEFLYDKVDEISESIRKELRNSPEILENKLAFDRIKDVVLQNISEGEVSERTSEKFDELSDNLMQLQNEVKALKAKNMRLTTENQNLVHKTKVLNENANGSFTKTEMDRIKEETERRVAERMAENVEGRGSIVSKEDIIAENSAADNEVNKTDDSPDFLKEMGLNKENLSKLLQGVN